MTMKPPNYSSSSSSQRKHRLSRYLLPFLAFFLIAAIIYGEGFICLLNQPVSKTDPDRDSPQFETRFGFGTGENREEKLTRPLESCDVFSGRWVRDESTRPLYQETDCPYIQPQLTCQAHGRPDKDYQFWRWQPRGCILPIFNGTMMLERLRGKRMMFVGDSLNRGMFVSLICLLQSHIPSSSKSMETFGPLTVFTLKKYNATIEFYWAPFLLESNADKADMHRVSDRIVRKGSINKHGRHWRHADVIIFNTYLWWMTGFKMKILEGSFKDEKKKIREMETEDAYRMALRSMVKWVRRNMDPNKTRVFFATMSPTHSQGIEWGHRQGENCYNQTSPIQDDSYRPTESHTPTIMRVIDQVAADRSAFPITVLNITRLSEYRKDAHTSIYKKQWSPLTTQQLANPVSYADCIHWCLPGLQDTWNELLFAKFVYS